LSDAWLGRPGAVEQDSVLLMNFSAGYDALVDGMEWRGVRTPHHTYARWLDGKIELYDRLADPLQMNNLADQAEHHGVVVELEKTMCELMAARGDGLTPCSASRSWFDSQRRVVRNAYGILSHPESVPDWSLLS